MQRRRVTVFAAVLAVALFTIASIGNSNLGADDKAGAILLAGVLVAGGAVLLTLAGYLWRTQGR